MDFSGWWLRHLWWNCPNIDVTGLHWWSVNIGSGNGLVPLANVDPDRCSHMVSLCHNELTAPIAWDSISQFMALFAYMLTNGKFKKINTVILRHAQFCTYLIGRNLLGAVPGRFSITLQSVTEIESVPRYIHLKRFSKKKIWASIH